MSDTLHSASDADIAPDLVDHDEGKRHITLTLTIDGQELTRTFKAYELSDIDWNPQINDMADTIEKGADPNFL